MTNVIDVTAELTAYDWRNARWTSGKLITVSPFRYDIHPSFFVDLETGGWHDSGATDERWVSGNFTKLLAFLRQESYEETADYLNAKYGNGYVLVYDENGRPTFRPPDLLKVRVKPRRIPERILESYRYRSEYLGRRGVSEKVQRALNIGYDIESKAVTIPWFNPDGSLGNVMYRKTEGKTFWYRKDSRPIGEMLYGIHIAYKRRLTKAAIVEAPIDSLTLMSNGIYAVATGGTAITADKLSLLIRSPIDEITIYRDRDEAGRMWQRKLIEGMCGKKRIVLAKVPCEYKDVNEAAVAGFDITNVTKRSISTFLRR